MSELGQPGSMAIASKQETAKLILELLDGSSERGLADMTPLRGSVEIQRVADGQKVLDLVHLHRWSPRHTQGLSR